VGELSCWAPLPKGTAPQVMEAAKRCESRGYAGVIGNQVYGPPWSALAVAAAGTSRLEIESGIAMGFVRSPFETACAALELDRLSEGRFALGLGTAPQPWTESYFDEKFSPPIGRLREVIEIVRLVNNAALAGTTTMPDYQGTHYQLSFEGLVPTFGPDVRPLPIWVAALRERLCELAGETADGLIGHPIWSRTWTFDHALPAMERGAKRAGRETDDLHVQLWLTASIDENVTVAARRARGNVAFYGGIQSYRSYFDAHGFGELADDLAEARRSLPLDQCVDLVPLEAARTFAVCGSADEVGQRLRGLGERAHSVCVKPPTWVVGPAEAAQQQERIEQILFD
jgi:probable F420-dependent oxidoreductase